MVKTKTSLVDDKYLPVHYNINSNLVDYMRKNKFKGENKIFTKMTQKNIIDPLLKGQHGLKNDFRC